MTKRTFSLTILLSAAYVAAAGPAAAGSYETDQATEVCGYLPYRLAGEARFAGPRPPAPEPANIGPQTTFPFAWDLARPAFLAAEVAEDIEDGRPIAAVRDVHGGALSLGEYMLFAAKEFDAPPPAASSEDVRIMLAAERPLNFHRLYRMAKENYEAVAGYLTADPTPAPLPTAVSAATGVWRPTYGLLAKAQADDMRIELLASTLSEDDIAEKEAVACLAHAVAHLGDAEAAGGVDRAKAAAARWSERPPVNVRALPREARTAFFDYEDSGDAVAEKIAALGPGQPDADAYLAIAKEYGAFATATHGLRRAITAAAAKTDK